MPIAKVNVLTCTNFVLIIADNVLVSVVRAYVVNELFQIKHCKLIVLPDGFTLVPVTRFAL